jgi:hypothetical protein
MKQTMSPKFKTQWLDQLRNGGIRQGRRAYRTSTCFCALGVLINIVRPNSWTTVNQHHYLPGGIKDHATYTTNAREILWEAQLSLEAQVKICEMNDADGKTFAEIADWVETNL